MVLLTSRVFKLVRESDRVAPKRESTGGDKYVESVSQRSALHHSSIQRIKDLR